MYMAMGAISGINFEYTYDIRSTRKDHDEERASKENREEDENKKKRGEGESEMEKDCEGWAGPIRLIPRRRLEAKAKGNKTE